MAAETLHSILEWYLINGRIILDYFHFTFDKIFYIFLYITMAFTCIYLIFLVFSIFSKKEYQEKELDISKAPFVTVQIPTRNEIIALRCAENCLKQDYPKDRYEILIGDDSDKPEISKQLVEFANNHEQVSVYKREKNIGFKPGNLNNLLKYSKGDILVLFDSDFAPGKDFLKRIVEPFLRDEQISAVQARWNFSNFNQNLVTIMASTIVYMFHHVSLSILKIFDTSSLCGSAEAVRKKDLIELGGWRSGSLTEDIEYTLRLDLAGKKLVYLPKLECYSDVPFKLKDLCRQQMRWAYGVINSYIIHFRSLVSSKKLSAWDKLLSMVHGLGYIPPVLILLLFMFGTLSFVTHPPAPIDLSKFFSKLGINILMTSGLIIASIYSLYRAKKSKYILKMIASSFTVGIVTTFYVNKGILKSILGKPMEWYLLTKNVKYIKE